MSGAAGAGGWSCCRPAVAATVVVGAAFGLAANGSSAGPRAASTSSVSADIHTALGLADYGYGYGGGYGFRTAGYGDGYSGGYGMAAPAMAAAPPPAPPEPRSGERDCRAEVGVVDINSELTYDQAESAGTGLVLTSNGEILTNNHVVEGATSISVTVVVDRRHSTRPPSWAPMPPTTSRSCS